jgi:hypothetical protein
LLDNSGDRPALSPVSNVHQWVRENYASTAIQRGWLAIHRCKHPDAADYPRAEDDKVYSYHTKLRAEHTRARRYNRETSR